MRAFTTVSTLVVLGLGLSLPAEGQKAASKKSADPARVDISELAKSMVVLHDGNGHYVIAMPTSEHYSKLFYGDGKTFHEQRVSGGGLDVSAQSMSATFWAPREEGNARLEQNSGKWQVICTERKTALTPLPPDKARALIERADFFKPLWKYEAYKLARDEDGNYYYVDQLRSEFGGKGFRMWMGPKGNMKRMKMTNIVSDSEGDIFATKTGELRFISTKSKKGSLWIKGKDRVELLDVPVSRNIPMIYGELGVYLGDLGTPCDHL